MYALVRLLTENKSVAYHTIDETFPFFENSVYSRILGMSTSFPPVKLPTFCLIDSDEGETAADIAFMTSKAFVHKTFPVMASSPQRSRYKTLRKQRYSVSRDLMPLWTKDELKKG